MDTRQETSGVITVDDDSVKWRTAEEAPQDSDYPIVTGGLRSYYRGLDDRESLDLRIISKYSVEEHTWKTFSDYHHIVAWMPLEINKIKSELGIDFYTYSAI